MASRYWVGTDGSWSDTANWSDTTGGTGGFSVPTASDDVFFDASSGSGTVTVDVSSVCDDLDFTGFTGTFAGSAALAISGSLTLATGMTRTYTGAITFNSTATGKTLTFNGKTTASTFTFNGVGGGWTVQDAWNNGTSDITLTAGSLDTNDQTITLGVFTSSNSNTRTIDLGTSTINATSWNTGTTTNLTFTVGTSTIAIYGSFAGAGIFGGGLTFNIVSVAYTSTSNTFNFSGANTFSTLTINGHSTKTASVTLFSNQTVTGTFTIAGNSLTNRLLVQSSTLGTARTITAATTTLSNCDFMDITGAGAGSWSGTSIGNALGNSGITFTTPVTRYAVVAGNWSSTATWSTTSGGSGGASVPLCHDTIILDASSGAGTYTMDMPRMGADVTCTGFTRTLAFSNVFDIFGSLTLSSGMTFNGFKNPTFRANSSKTVTMAGKSFVTSTVTFSRAGGTWTLQDDFTASQGLLVISEGTLDANDHDVSATAVTTLTNGTIIMGSGNWTVDGLYNTAVWNALGTITPETSTIVINNVSTGTFTFGGSKTYNKLQITGSAGSSTYAITGSNTFAEIETLKTVAHTFRFNAGTTQTITNWNISGTASNLVSLTSSSTANYTLTKAGGGQVRADYLDIRHSVATPSDTWYAGVNSTDNQSIATAGSGWIFNVPLPTVTTQAVSDISDLTATANGNITDDGSGVLSERGFIVRTTTSEVYTNGFETNATGFTQVSGTTADWARTTVRAQTGTYSYGSGLIGNNQTSGTQYTQVFTGDGLLTFSYKVSTEEDYDFLYFYIDDVLQFSASGEVDWTTVSYSLTSGSHTFKWLYEKDVSVSDGDDKVFIDNLSIIDYGTRNYPEVGTFSEGAFTGSLTSLTPEVTYYVRAYAENQGGFGYGSEVSFTTLATPLVPEVTTQAVSSVATTTATGNGTIVDENGSDVTRRGFVLSTSSQTNPGSTSPEASAYSIIASDSGSFSVGAYTKSVTGLTTQTTYYIRAFTENSVGFAYGEELSFITAGLPTATIQSPSARQSTTATLNGTITDDGELSVTARGFVYDTVSRALPGNVAPGASGYASTAGDTGTFTEGTFNEPITGLSQNTTYYARAYAQNSVGYRYSDELTFSTLVFPNSSSVTNGTTNSVTLTNKQTTGVAIINLDTTTTNVTNL